MLSIAINIRDPETDAILETLFKTTNGVDVQTIPMTSFDVAVSAYAGTDVRIDVELQIEDDCLTTVLDFFRVY